MPACPHCDTELPEGERVCPSCGLVLQEGGGRVTDWAVALVVTSQLEAEMVKGLLENSGIPARLEGEAIGQIYGLTTGPLAQVKVLVPREALDLARKIGRAHV